MGWVIIRYHDGRPPLYLGDVPADEKDIEIATADAADPGSIENGGPGIPVIKIEGKR